jgi:transcriptional regulator with XRE-family HTH domain
VSIKIFTKKVPKRTVEYITFFGVDKNQASKEGIANLIRRVQVEKGIGLRDIEEQSGRKGNKITHGYLSKILSGHSSNPSRKKLEAIALGLDVPLEVVHDAARGIGYEDTEEFSRSRFADMALKYEQLQGEEKRIMEKVLSMVEREFDRLERINSNARENQRKTNSSIYVPPLKPMSNTSHTNDFTVLIDRIQKENPDIDVKTISDVCDGEFEGVDRNWLEIIQRHLQYYTPLETFADNDADKSAHRKRKAD